MLTIPQEHADAMIAHALKDDPNECCGMLAIDAGRVIEVYPLRNAEASPVRYNIDPDDLFTVVKIESKGHDLGIFHSHTHSEAYPSETDIRLATYPDAYYVIISLADRDRPIIRAYRIRDGQVTEEPVETA